MMFCTYHFTCGASVMGSSRHYSIQCNKHSFILQMHFYNITTHFLQSFIHSFVAACSNSIDILTITYRHIDETFITRYYSYTITVYTCTYSYHQVLHCALLSLQLTTITMFVLPLAPHRGSAPSVV